MMRILLSSSVVAMFAMSHASAAMVAYFTFDNELDMGENTGTGVMDWNQSSDVAAVPGRFGGGGGFFAGASQFWDADFDVLGVTMTSFTISMHVQGDADAWRDYLSFGNADGIAFLEHTGGNTTALWGVGGADGVNVQSPTDVSSGWHHLGVVGDGATLSYYVNGAFVGSTNNFSTGTMTSFQLGSRWGDGVRAITADIDDVAIFDEVLSADQMAFLSLNAAGSATQVPEPGLQALLALGGFTWIMRRRQR
ncbi:LamG-like jellyroll fold domain-containing protein [Sulfuriroseicoccus oceanibius]|uniref:PEP-CTERM sorting domain-containing protein n=1 Tax=Sulfuriroseicoccus oceanibius TaxID=2707525 RepID=A0A6B3L8M4_9BACT|nr:LamG-like jellyroll fold domain-containing protein [Sulfuriroseicoccus oceanibius]QQL44664.1 PEP-CTERM sorting domain-containing protein [Sulfuriroseicoccus oceanibius]